MSGLFLLFIAIVWLIIVLLITVFVAKRMSKTVWQLLVSLVLFLTLLPLPLMDEIMGKRQFEQLCHENSVIHVDRKTAIGRTVYLKNVPNENIPSIWMSIRKERWQFVDVNNDELVLSYNILHATRNWFRLSESGYPFTFEGYCEPKSPPATVKAFAEYGITYVEPPTTKAGEIK